MKIRKKGKEFVRTVGGHYLVDLDIHKRFSFDDLDYNIRRIPGVLETGFFIGLADKINVVHNSKIIVKKNRL